MPDLERRLISKALLERNFGAVLEAGIKPEFFTHVDSRTVFEFSTAYWREHRVTPIPRRIREEFPGYRLYTKVEYPLSDCIAQVRKARATEIMVRATQLAADALDVRDPTRAGDAFQAAVREAAQDTNTVARENIPTVIEDRITALLNRRFGFTHLLGLETGFPTMDRATLGLQPQQLIIVIGLPKAGKSSLLMLLAAHAQRQLEKYPFLISFEMSADEQKDRYIAMGAGVSLSALISGQLTEGDIDKVTAFGGLASAASRFHLCTDVSRTATLSMLEALILHEKPDVAFVDGVYMMSDEVTRKPGSDWQAMTNLTRGFKKMAQRLEIPIVISTQVLESKTGKGGRLRASSGGYSSSIEQDCDLLMGLERNEERRKNNEAVVRILTSRNCAPHEVVVEWNWRRGRFGREIDVVETDEEDDDDEDGP